MALRVLILSYHSLPLDVIASYRAEGFFAHFKKYDIFPTLLSMRWERNKNNVWRLHVRKDSIQHQSSPLGARILLPRYKRCKSFSIGALRYALYSVPAIRYFYIAWAWLRGHLDTTPEAYDAYLSTKNFLFNYLKQNSYDVVLAIFSPHHHARLAYEIHKRFGIPYVLDFRDLWSNRIMDTHYRPRLGNAFKMLARACIGASG